MIEKTRMYKHNNTPLNKTGPNQQYVLAGLSHIVTRPVPPHPPPKIVISLAGTCPAEFRKLKVPHTSERRHSRPDTNKRAIVIQSLFLPLFPLSRLRSDHFKGLRRSGGHTCTRRLHLEEPALTADAPKVTTWVTQTDEPNFSSFKKKVPQARQSSRRWTVLFCFFFPTTDKNIAQGRRSDWQEERNGS